MTKKVYCLDRRDNEVYEYNDLQDCITDIIDTDCINSVLKDGYIPTNCPITDCSTIQDLIEEAEYKGLFINKRTVEDDIFYYLLNEISDYLNSGEKYYNLYENKISYNKVF